MEKTDILSYGVIYDIILGLLAVCFAVDAVSIVRCVKAGEEELREYAKLCVKYLTIVMKTFAGVFYLIVAFTYGLETASAAIHGVLGVLLLADGAVSLFIKLKYGRRS